MIAPRFAPSELPARMRGLPLDHRGFPVPWFVAFVDSEGKLANQGDTDAAPDFRVVDTRKLTKAIRERRCWLCGHPLGRNFAFVIGPMCAVNRINSEPPSHRECALFAVRACPFLARPRMRRNEVDLPAGMVPAPGVHLDHNPGVMGLWTTRAYTITEPAYGQPGILFELGEPLDLAWFAEGRAATQEEIMEALDKGLKALRPIAAAQPGGLEELGRQLDKFRALTKLPI